MKILLSFGFVLMLFSVSAQTVSEKLKKSTFICSAGNVKVYMNFDKYGYAKSWSNLYPECIAVYEYSVSGNNISTTWMSNSCGSTGTNQTFIFDEKSATPMFYGSNDSNMKFWASAKIPK
jgi:hypothetical protein